MSRAKLLLASTVLVAFAQAALAATSVEVSGLTPTLGGDKVKKIVIVKFDDLNPAEKAGADALFSRLNLVAGKLCASNNGGNGSLLTDKVEKCRAQALSQAIKDVNTPALSAIAAAAK